ncbi:MAG: UPF0175 family protein [Acidobacteriota bacterium]
MNITLPDDVLRSAHVAESDVQVELALTLFAQERLTLGQAAILAGMGQLEFQRLLAERKIPIHYGIEEWQEDLETLRTSNS